MKSDGTEQTQLTDFADNGIDGAAPEWHPSKNKILFVSNGFASNNLNWDIYEMTLGGGIEQCAPISISVSPSSATVPLGSTQLFTAIDQNNNPISVDWSSSDETVGTVSLSGGTSTTFTAHKVGAATVRAIKDGVEGSASVTVPDETAPTTIDNSPLTWQKTDFTVTLTCTDNLGGSGCKETYYRIDGGTWQTGASILISEDGDHTIEYYSVDNAGNEEIHTTIHAKLDKTAPTIDGAATTAPNANGWNNGDVTVHFDCTDGLSTVESCTSDTVISSEGAGQSVAGSVTDKAGNTASTSVDGINIDKTAPAISINTPVPYGLYTAGTALSFGASDNLSGLDGEAFGLLTDIDGITSHISTDFVPSPGVYTLIVEAADKAGNIAHSDQSFFVVYDPTGGFATGGGWLIPDAESTVPNGRANFGFLAKYKDGGSTGNLEFQYKDAEINLKSSSIDWLTITGISAIFQGTATINGDGLYTFRVTAKDNAEPGAGADNFDIRIWQGTGTDSDPYHKAKNVISGGNIVVHKK